jgi:hypothetical protein
MTPFFFTMPIGNLQSMPERRPVSDHFCSDSVSIVKGRLSGDVSVEGLQMSDMHPPRASVTDHERHDDAGTGST